MPLIEFFPAARQVEVEVGTTLLQAARRAGVVIEAPCDGVGTCGKCKVRRLAGETRTIVGARHALSRAEQADGWLLACQEQVCGDLRLELAERQRETGLRIAHGGAARSVPLRPAVGKEFVAATGQTLVHSGEDLLGVEQGDTRGEQFGLAVDIGTTTLVVALIDLRTGAELAVASSLNPQARHAQDVLSRIRFASREGGLSQLRGELLDALNQLTAEVAAAAGIGREAIYEAVLCGNTCMLHLATGTDPSPLGHSPYTPTLSGGSRHPAAEFGLEIAAVGQVYLPPIISAYVGADLSAGLLAAGLDSETRSMLLIDIGTNGEMILAHQGRLFATSTAAGPAFEGMNIRCGMRAAAGAIERVRIDADGAIALQTIGERDPLGLCGSGLLDAVAELLRSGVVTRAGGFLRSADSLPASLGARLVARDGKPVFVIADEVVLTRGDLRQVQLAKGAIRAGIDLLLRQVGLSPEQLDGVLIAGSFGLHLRPESLLTIGLLPPEFAGRIEFVGNTAKSGSQALLLNRDCRPHLQQLVGKIEVLELAHHAEFAQVFVASLGF
ncbi:ASKHA domain-containing protein [Desulfuromonas carbonis]|uniref:ASKHA domain-containing protein n=1 Tax=Desulfuromonas sp. DDH964 TaxID=1823759 RepID=UPI00078DAB94|nr:ASKHA domain-containing protein [Desulfuromonas sp. DDH964]AMV70574.1 ferredoxin [Desulfuromonas sp. DDH964]